MPDPEVAQQDGTGTPAETPTETLVAQPGVTDTPSDGARVTEPGTAEEKAPAPTKPSREEQLERELQASRSNEAKAQETIRGLLAAGDPVARKASRENQIAIARLDSATPDEAERKLREQHASDDVKTEAETKRQEYSAKWKKAADDMTDALKAAGLSWDAPELAELRGEWDDDWNSGRVNAAARHVRKVQAMKKADSTSANGTPTQRRSAQQRSQDLDDDGGPSGGARPTATRENIDELFMAYERNHPDQPNPYAAQYREILNNQ